MISWFGEYLHNCISLFKVFDEILDKHETYFPETGLRKTSLIRLAFLAIVSTEKISGSIGKIQPTMLKDLLQRLATFIVS